MTTNEIYNQETEGIENFTNEDHINAMWTALNNGSDSVKYAENNGDGSIHIFEFEEGNAPNFGTVSDDVFHQIEIRVVKTPTHFEKELDEIRLHIGARLENLVRERIGKDTTAILPIVENEHGTFEVCSSFRSCDFVQICEFGMGRFPLIPVK